MALVKEEKHPLKWPDGWSRAAIAERKPQGGWKKSTRDYISALYKELERMGASEVLVTYNPSPSDRTDPGVAVWFSLELKQDHSWQIALALDTPAPTLEQIDDAFRKKAMQHHPDRGGDVETFRALSRHRDNARAWILGTQKQEHEYCIPCDRFTEVRLNIAAVKLAITAMRQLDRVGVPGMLARSFKGFRTALPENVAKVEVPA